MARGRVRDAAAKHKQNEGVRLAPSHTHTHTHTHALKHTRTAHTHLPHSHSHKRTYMYVPTVHPPVSKVQKAGDGEGMALRMAIGPFPTDD
ncbi:hypothetical protein BU24DRAFT_247416 [Aaosphaeria arxii CBS 175.79]|uniref:Uncharacterized protein n=1 Tax=Aaosphaeria arxii CBS 175.79 TaxID=1450172 RepID=A0A6A5XLV1_9PLEO|nr:uncharacterized protein BU24DRAFT_247416 [Aaosphaeria arxii CBS 175.79]KAF2013797.1 hypothetical protein BU24DRAFT_247416 [Aaosphaeria arxii CBS 175.79]